VEKAEAQPPVARGSGKPARAAGASRAERGLPAVYREVNELPWALGAGRRPNTEKKRQALGEKLRKGTQLRCRQKDHLDGYENHSRSKERCEGGDGVD